MLRRDWPQSGLYRSWISESPKRSATALPSSISSRAAGTAPQHEYPIYDRPVRSNPTHPVQALLLDRRWGTERVKSAQTIDWAQKHQIRLILVGPVPEYDAPLARLEAHSIAWNKPDLVSKHRAGDEDHVFLVPRLCVLTLWISLPVSFPTERSGCTRTPSQVFSL
jgi:hypothetical protein